MRTTAIVIGVALLVAAQGATSKTIHVPLERPTIQGAIDAASYGDLVVVACGTYYEHDIVMKSGIHLRSETGEPDCVTIDAQQQGRVIHCQGVDSATSIEGFTITGGYARSTPDYYQGGGVFCDASSSPTITNCVLVDNEANSGGALKCSVNSHPTITHCTFTENTAGCGGAIYPTACSPTISDCVFSNNSSPNGGAIAFWFSTSSVITDCVFSGNSACYGGAIQFTYASPTLNNCTLAGNSASCAGGAMICFESSPSFGNVAIAFNAGESLHCDDALSYPTLTCCDVFGNSGGDWTGCIAGQYGVDGNVSVDPLFCAEQNPNDPYTLHANSPCAENNNPECGRIGARGIGCDLSASESTSWGNIKGMYR